MIGLVIALVVLGVPLAALRFGADSRDGRDWKPLGGFSSDEADLPLRHATSRTVRPLHRKSAHT
ncbi:MAG: hypothetical protein ABSD85_06225 [Acidimicrobiales bacterium]|jgi:hypothetical protein